ncbi:fungal specific transcription factor [Fusarium phyllophilum]|uniref:Fungal specific transcription factor n=1 Tax=Fusarium phyllophilum TaxID=47803 RepID=A0A8H5NII0_9HYPO|nr:fungal specific transcription factor [Fusarium phyllophilum]
MGNFKVCIVGGDLAGSLLANGLINNGIDTIIFERDEESLKREGYQIRLGDPALTGLASCLTDSQLESIVQKLGRYSGSSKTAPSICNAKFQTILDLSALPTYSKSSAINRVVLRDLLLDPVIAEGKVKFGKHFPHYEIINKEPGGKESVKVNFSDGSSEYCDILVAADGSGSKKGGDQEHDEDFDFDENQASFYWSLSVPRELCPFDDPSDIPDRRKFCLDIVRNWAPEYHVMLSAGASDENNITVTMPRASTKLSKNWRQRLRARNGNNTEEGHPRVWLVGDAVHAMQPSRGMGGNQAMRDVADMLPELLELVRAAEAGPPLSAKEIETRCNAYEKKMIDRSFAWVAKSGGTALPDQQLQQTASQLGDSFLDVGASFPDTYRLAENDQQGSVYFGDAANESFFQQIRQLVARTLGSCPFVEQPIQYHTNHDPSCPVSVSDPPSKPNPAHAQQLVSWGMQATSHLLGALDESEVQAQIGEWLQQDDNAASLSSAICYLILANGALTCPENEDATAEAYYLYARYLTHSKSSQGPNLSSILCHNLIAFYQINSGRRDAAYHSIGVACRLACAMGIHKVNKPHRMIYADSALGERLCKALWLFDTFASGSLGRPICTYETRNTKAEKGYSSAIDMAAIIEAVLREVYGPSKVSRHFITNMTQKHRSWATRMASGLKTDGDGLPKRLPFPVHSAFTAALTLGVATFADLDHVFPLRLNLDTAGRLLQSFEKHDSIARYYCQVVQQLQSACDEYVEQRNNRIIEKQSHLVGELLGRLQEKPPMPKQKLGNMNGGWADETVTAMGLQSPLASLPTICLTEDSAIECDPTDVAGGLLDMSLDSFQDSALIDISNIEDSSDIVSLAFSSLSWYQ